MEDRPMNEYEGALFDALMTLTRAIVTGQTTRAALAALYRELAKSADDLGRGNWSATLELLASIAESDTFYTIPRPPLTVIEGGKTEPENSN